MKSRRIALLVVAAVVFATSAWAVVNYRRTYPPFDREQWVRADLFTRTRAGVVNDLLRRHPLNGMTRAEVAALLGPPTPTDKFDDWDMVYVLGPDSNYGVDFEWLVIDLDQQGRVAKRKVVSD